MSLLNSSVSIENATGVVAKNYDRAKEIVGFIPSLCEFMSINPYLQTKHMDYIETIISHPTLSGKLFASIRLLVSNDSSCDYCVDFNESMLTNVFDVTAEEITIMKDNPSLSPLDDKEKALLLFVIKSTKDSLSTTDEDITLLKSRGCSEIEIYDATYHGANMVAGDIMINAFKIA